MGLKNFKAEFKKIKNKYAFEIISSIVNALFKLEKIFYSCKCINYPKEKCVCRRS